MKAAGRQVEGFRQVVRREQKREAARGSELFHVIQNARQLTRRAQAPLGSQLFAQ